jgi:hypothetical protein
MAGRERRKFADKIDPLDHHDGRCSSRANCVQPVTKSSSLGRVRGARLPFANRRLSRFPANVIRDVRCVAPRRRE